MRRQIALLVPVFVLAACAESNPPTSPTNVATPSARSTSPSLSSAASGAQTLTTIVDEASTFTNDLDCPFPLEETVSGSIKDMLYLDADGNPVKEILTPQFRGPLTVSWTNLATGKTLSSHEAAPLIVNYNPDGSFASLQNVGLLFHVSIPGQGNVLLDVGRVVIIRGQGIVYETGKHQELNGDTGAFCAAFI
jgi:hypothetical protein